MLRHRMMGMVGGAQPTPDRFFIEKDPVRLRFHANGTVDMLGGDTVVGEPMDYVIEDGEVVIRKG